MTWLNKRHHNDSVISALMGRLRELKSRMVHEKRAFGDVRRQTRMSTQPNEAKRRRPAAPHPRLESRLSLVDRLCYSPLTDWLLPPGKILDVSG